MKILRKNCCAYCNKAAHTIRFTYFESCKVNFKSTLPGRQAHNAMLQVMHAWGYSALARQHFRAGKQMT
eukprot:2325413-Amphidinium_carterae.1